MTTSKRFSSASCFLTYAIAFHYGIVVRNFLNSETHTTDYHVLTITFGFPMNFSLHMHSE
jgi:hypothetical protein